MKISKEEIIIIITFYYFILISYINVYNSYINDPKFSYGVLHVNMNETKQRERYKHNRYK
jgi:hypothetical protein